MCAILMHLNTSFMKDEVRLDPLSNQMELIVCRRSLVELLPLTLIMQASLICFDIPG